MKRFSVKAFKALFILLSLCFAGCSQANNTPSLIIPDSAENNPYAESSVVTLSCNYKVSSEVSQKNLGRSASVSADSRSATASIPSGISYFVTAVTSDGSKTVNVPQSDIDETNRKFTIGLQTGYEWKITVGIKNSAGKEILSDSVTKRLTPNDTLMAPNFKLKPHITAGKTGDLSLNVSCPTGYSLSVADETSTSWSVSPDPLIANKFQITAANVPSGTYNLVLTFSAAGRPPFSTTQIVTIYDNLETNSWHSGGNDLINEEDNFELTTEIVTVAAENRTDFYVDGTSTGSGNDSNSGNYQAPLATIGKAFSLINAVGNDTLTYNVHIKNGTSSTISSCIDITKNITVECYSEEPGDNAGTATLTATGAAEGIFAVDGHTFQLSGLNIDGGNLSNMVGISASSSSGFTSVTLNSGSIKHCEKGITITGSNTAVYLYGGEITDNVNTDSTNLGAGISYGGGYLYIKGSPKVTGNKASDNSPQNIYLAASKKITVQGPLETGAQLGIMTAASPTLAEPVAVTLHYTTQNGTTHPSSYFTGDVYGISKNSDGEATLNLSGGEISHKYYDSITMTCAKSTAPSTTITSDTVSKATGLPRTYVFYAYGDDGTSLTGYVDNFKLISVRSQGTGFGVTYAEQQTGVNKNKVQLKAACLPGIYYITMGYTYNENTYTATLRVVVTD